jgi:hypothetical protein
MVQSKFPLPISSAPRRVFAAAFFCPAAALTFSRKVKDGLFSGNPEFT